MRNKLLWRIVLAALAAAAVLAAGCQSKYFGYDESEKDHGDKVALANCLTRGGAVMYGANWCGYTKQEIADFGDAFPLINYVECTVEVDRCNAAGITGYPTWIIDGKKHAGYKDLETLSDYGGCNY